jgi:hypothetical protein
MSNLYVAAGGGGDAIAASIISRTRGHHNNDTIIATYAWDRLRIDPLPGPRSPSDFTGLEPLGERNYTFTPQTKPKPPSGSTLPRLASELPERLALIDPTSGAVGISQQLVELAQLVGATDINLIDVGGDILASGGEPNLKSPLADSLALAAAARIDLPINLYVVGVGLDGELSADELAPKLPAESENLTSADTEPFEQIFEWHPSEATALLVAATQEARGQVEVRDQGYPIQLSDESTAVYRFPASEAIDCNELAKRLRPTTSLDEVETHTRSVCGKSEIDYERRKAANLDQARQNDRLTSHQLEVVERVLREAHERGTDFITVRRLAEAIGPAASIEAVRMTLAERFPDNRRSTIWSTTPEVTRVP